MKKTLAAFGAVFLLLAVVLFAPVVKVKGATPTTLFSVWLQSSQIDSTTIGATTPSTGAFTSLSSTSGALNGTIGATTANTGAFTSLSATSATVSGLTNGNCVQASTGGLLTTTSAPCNKQVENVALTTGICPSAMPNAAFASCSTAITFPTAFADTNYSLTFSVGPASACCLTGVWFTNKTTSGVTIVIQNGDASAANPITVSEIDVHASHL